MNHQNAIEAAMKHRYGTLEARIRCYLEARADLYPGMLMDGDAEMATAATTLLNDFKAKA